MTDFLQCSSNYFQKLKPHTMNTQKNILYPFVSTIFHMVEPPQNPNKIAKKLFFFHGNFYMLTYVRVYILAMLPIIITDTQFD